MLKKSLFIGSICLISMACGNNATVNTNTNANVANSPANIANVANTVNSAPQTNANKPANPTASVKPAESGPKRVSFAAGKSEGAETVTLGAGESKQFVIGAKTGQIFMVEADSKDLEIKMIKGKDSDQMKEPGHYDSTLLADGDYVFEVKNTSSKEVKSSLKIFISHTDISK